MIFSALRLGFSHTHRALEGFIEDGVKRKTLAVSSGCTDEQLCGSKGSKDKDENRAGKQMGYKPGGSCYLRTSGLSDLFQICFRSPGPLRVKQYSTLRRPTKS